MAHALYLLLLVGAAVAATPAHHPLDHVHALVRCFAQQVKEMLFFSLNCHNYFLRFFVVFAGTILILL
jgi:hypothetical protein